MKDNKLIAEFMGKDDLYQGMSEARAKRIYNYHTSWDWIMPVVKECKEQIEYEDNKHYHHIEDTLLSYLDIDETYNAVVEFINQLNNNTNER